MSHDEAIFAGGCFWCTEAVFGQLTGVHSVQSGYIGGTTVDPTYKEVAAVKPGMQKPSALPLMPKSSATPICWRYFLRRMIRRS